MCQSGHMCGRFTVRKTYLIVIDNTLKSFAPPGSHTHIFRWLTLCLSYLMRSHPFIPTIATMDCCHCRLKSVITDNPCPVNEPTYGMSRATDMSLFSLYTWRRFPLLSMTVISGITLCQLIENRQRQPILHSDTAGG